MGWWWPGVAPEALTLAVHARDLLKEVTIIFMTSTIVRPQVKQQGGNTTLPFNRKLIKDLLSMVPPHQNKTQFPPQSLSPIRKLPLGSDPSPLESRETENHNHRKLNNLITWTTALSNSMKLRAMLCRATQGEPIMVENSDRMWSTGEGNDKPLQ